MSHRCKICAQPVESHGRAKVRKKYNALYVRCACCGFISVEDPFWLPEAYAEPINASDTGYMARNLWCRDRVRMVIELFLSPTGRFLDYAAGYGVFVRLMRDIGYDFRWTDPYCENLFARHFEEPLPLESRFEAITAFEVLEHLVDPMSVLNELASSSSCLIFSTDLLPTPAPAPTAWWYYGLEHGQHVSFFALSTLEYIADRMSLHLSSDGISFHVLTREKLPMRVFRRMDSRLWRALFSRTRQRASKSEADHELVSTIQAQAAPQS